MTAGLKLIVFDCDGTLVDSQHLIVRAMQLAFEEISLAPPSRTAILRTVGLSIPEALLLLAPDTDFETRQCLSQSYRDWNFSLRETANMQEPMFKGAHRLLLNLSARDDVVLGIATGKSRRGVNRFLEQNGLEGLFLTLQTADDAPSKPHPAMLLQAMSETGMTPEATIMIGDTTYDITMALRADVTPVGVGWGHHGVAELRKAGARIITETVDHLATLLFQEVIAESKQPVAA